MSPLNVHMNRNPDAWHGRRHPLQSRQVLPRVCRQGLARQRAERGPLEDAQGRRLCFVQIAGFIARRIVCYLQTRNERRARPALWHDQVRLACRPVLATGGERPGAGGRPGRGRGDGDRPNGSEEGRARASRCGGRVPPPLRKGVYILPNLITTGGLFAGFYSVICQPPRRFPDRRDLPSWWRRSSTSSTGASRALTRTHQPLRHRVRLALRPRRLRRRPRHPRLPLGARTVADWGWLAASLYVTCGALRLARFNVQYRQRREAALHRPADSGGRRRDRLGGAALLLLRRRGGGATSTSSCCWSPTRSAGLMVSGIQYFSFKEVELYRRQPFWMLIAVHPAAQAVHRRAAAMLFAGCSAVRDARGRLRCRCRCRARRLRSRAGRALAPPVEERSLDKVEPSSLIRSRSMKTNFLTTRFGLVLLGLLLRCPPGASGGA